MHTALRIGHRGEDLVSGCRGCLFGIFSTHVYCLLLYFVFVLKAPGDS